MIDPTTQLAAMIRAQFSAQFRAQAQARERGVAGREAPHDARTTTGGKPPQPPSPADSTDAEIRQMVALRVRALSPDDPQRQRKAFRLFLESVLMQAFGRERLDDRGFDQMVDAVLERMEGDAELHAALREAGDLLLADAQPGPSPSR